MLVCCVIIHALFSRIPSAIKIPKIGNFDASTRSIATCTGPKTHHTITDFNGIYPTCWMDGVAGKKQQDTVDGTVFDTKVVAVGNCVGNCCSGILPGWTRSRASTYFFLSKGTKFQLVS